jgi:ribosomal protein S18 acetylase RimI-like enzyme
MAIDPPAPARAAAPAPFRFEVQRATEATDDLLLALNRLIPQLSASAAPLSEYALADILAATDNALLVALDRERGGAIVGTLTLVVFRIPTGLRAWIEDVVVDTDARGQGVGRALTAEAMRLAAARRVRTLDLTSSPSRLSAHRLYVSLGFELRGSSVYRHIPESK